MSPNFPIFIFLVHLIFSTPVAKPVVEGSRMPGKDYPYQEVEWINKDGDEKGYHIFYPRSNEVVEAPVVLFIHGYGAINPKIFASWIDHLVLQGNIVIYPRYQQNLLFPSTDQFTGLVADAYKNAIADIDREQKIKASGRFIVAGHSYGGVITANLAVLYDSLDLPRPDAIFCCEPGHGPLTGGVLDSYSEMDSTIPAVIMVGDKDWTVGDVFGKRLFNETPMTQPKVFIRQIEARYDSMHISASHYEPYAFGDSYDSGNQNLTYNRALKVARLNEVDFYGYWKILDTLIQCADGKPSSCLGSLAEPWDLGCWPGTTVPINAIQIEATTGL